MNSVQSEIIPLIHSIQQAMREWKDEGRKTHFRLSISFQKLTILGVYVRL